MKRGRCDLVLYDENMVQIGKMEDFGAFFDYKEKGDVFTVSVTIDTGISLA
jgi:hypothetical protein